MQKLIRPFFIFLMILSFIASILIIVGAISLYKYSSDKVNDELLEQVKQSHENQFYRFERSGEYVNPTPVLIEQKNNKSAGYVEYENISQNLINAFIAIEDKRFFKHNGIDYIRSTHAVFNYLTRSKDRSGGSTITQQLVKNLTGNDKRLVERKISEAFCALDLERKYDKTEILEMYLNVVNLSNGCIGIGEATEFYFSKDAASLTIKECACLAAIVKSPSKYDPILHPDNNAERAKTVLLCMLDQGYINENEYRKAIDEPLCINKNEKGIKKYNSWYIDAVIDDVIEDLARKYGISKQSASLLFYKGGYRIYTAMDNEIQSILEEYYLDIDNFSIDGSYDGLQSSSIIIDPDTGDILALVGAVGHKNGDRILNYATQTKRPPASTIKPLSVYALAIEKGIVNWSSIIEDSPVTTLKNGSLWPQNASKTYAGNVTIRYALENSLNTVAVKLLHEIGNKESFEFLTEKLGVSSLNRSKDMGDAALALGQPSSGITLRELVTAYSMFNDGIMRKSRIYYKVTDSNGKIILDNTAKEEQVISPETAAIMTKLLQAVIETGSANGYITINEFTEVAGKTGTSQSNMDKCFVGFTPSLICGVWTGYTNPAPLDRIGGNISAIFWDEIMYKINEKTEYFKDNIFRIPTTVRKYSYSTTDGKLPRNFTCSDKMEEGWFVYNDKLLGIN